MKLIPINDNIFNFYKKMGDFIEIQIDNIPEYLKKSGLFKVFNEDLDEENNKIKVPKRNFKEDETVNTFYDLENLMHTYRYWMIKKFSLKKIFDFVSKNKNYNYSSLIKEFYNEFPFIIQLSYLSKVDSLDINYLISYDYLYLLKYHCIKNKKIKFNSKACELAVERDNLKMVKFMATKACYWNSKCPEIAAKNNSLEMIKFLHEKRCKFNIYATDYAVEQNNLECLKYLIENNSKVDIDICSTAAENNSLECLKYLIEKGYTLNEDVIKSAATHCSYEVLKYIFPRIYSSAKYNLLELMISYYDDDIKIEDFKKCFKYLVQLGFKITDNLIKISLLENKLELLKIILEEKVDFKENALFGKYDTKENALCIKFINDNFPNLAIGLNSFKEMESLREELLIGRNKNKEAEILKYIDSKLSCEVLKNIYSETRYITVNNNEN